MCRLALLMLLSALPALAQAPTSQPDLASQLTPPIHGKELRTRAADAYARGLAYVLATQNADGSWGSHDPAAPMLKDFGFGTTSRGAQDGVRMACTAIIAKALLRDPQPTAAINEAIRRATDALLAREKIHYEAGEAFNTWGYGYKLDFLCALMADPRGSDRRETLREAAAGCVRGLLRYQQSDGGWNYYASPLARGNSMSFNTANIIDALARARALGVAVPQGMIADAVRVLLRMRTIRGSFLYDARFIRPSGAVAEFVNDVGSPSRTAAATLGLIRAEALKRSDARIAARLFAQDEHWLEDGRKLIVPHTAVDQISGYFFFYGYHYHAELLALLGDEVSAERWERSAWTMIRTQETSGCWWDTAAAAYGDKWATGFALMVLQRYLHRDPDSPTSQPAPDQE